MLTIIICCLLAIFALFDLLCAVLAWHKGERKWTRIFISSATCMLLLLAFNLQSDRYRKLEKRVQNMEKVIIFYMKNSENKYH